ncbi:hypothetical protein [Chroococcidiopsis sp. CCALA 051]|uniref:hypothetical protein n=1 Tax=Chroococcidiopsis sp. CCALA 051 TaxID=869949 RepID=UPI0011B1ED8F|nr:hypothetical protein [Chroococcidiopsis sp. CCALA 051]
MRIRLERKLSSCPHHLCCTVCDRMFESGRVRTLLHNDEGFIQGDICPECMRLSVETIQHKIRERAMLLLEETDDSSNTTFSPQARAMELLDCSTENVKYPQFYDWWLVQLEIFSRKSSDARNVTGIENWEYKGRSRKAQDRSWRERLRTFFEKDESEK